ncbi:MAG: UDP-N-acetylmuramoylalanine--D-glutamate ligase, partial [Kiritimatiellae bacterium]|nr:UDP-N-acetylmuramoylalanine--D-glutamate ligase [Kiritimatiellia bacterium]
RAFGAFEPLPHRFQLVAERGGVRFVDDSKATSVAALVAGVAMAGSGVRLIAGGLAKGDDAKVARDHLTKRVKKVYLIGRCAEEFRSAWAGAADCEVCGTLERAVESATRDAAKGETVLLSPGTASYDQFRNYGERGDVFASLVNKEGKQRQ